jgi:hypothetical protein
VLSRRGQVSDDAKRRYRTAERNPETATPVDPPIRPSSGNSAEGIEDMTRMRVAIGCTMPLAASTTIAGCQTHSADQASGDTTMLTLATIDDVNDNGESYGPQGGCND